MDHVVSRSCSFDIGRSADMSTDDRIPVVISTDAPVPMELGGKIVNEILDHSPESVDLSRFPLPLVEDHENAKTAIAVFEDPVLEGGRLRAMCRFGTQTRAQEVRRDVLGGVIRSLSAFYRRLTPPVRDSDTAVRTTKWMPMHASPVGAPADMGAGFFRSASPPAATAVIPGTVMTDPAAGGAAPIAPSTTPTVPDAAAIRAAAQAEAKEIAAMADSLGLRSADFVSLGKDGARDAMLKAVADGKRAAMPEPAAPVVTLTVDHADKQVDAVADAFVARAGYSKPGNGNPYAGRSLMGMARKYAQAIGIRSAADWENKDTAHFVLGELSQVHGGRDAANVSTASFPNFVMLNAMTKVVCKGFESAPRGLVGPSGAPIYDTQRVPDFKSFTIGGLGTGSLQETAENTAFPELSNTECAYSDTAKMWGGTLSLSIQALISDDTGAFDRSLRQAGPIAQKAIERRLVQKFLRGIATTDASTWTGNTTSGCSPVWTTADTLAAARAKVGLAPAAMMSKVGLDGNPLGNMPRFVLAGPTAGNYLAGLYGQAPGQTVYNGQYELVITPWLEASTITGYSTTSFYYIADPAMVTGLILSLISGYESPQVQEYDAGAVGARKWKIWQPAEADLFWATNKAGTSIIPGAHQATT
jgi:hypothetical protein